jgi:hypothetical protein
MLCNKSYAPARSVKDNARRLSNDLQGVEILTPLSVENRNGESKSRAWRFI